MQRGPTMRSCLRVGLVARDTIVVIQRPAKHRNRVMAYDGAEVARYVKFAVHACQCQRILEDVSQYIDGNEQPISDTRKRTIAPEAQTCSAREARSINGPGGNRAPFSLTLKHSNIQSRRLDVANVKPETRH